MAEQGFDTLNDIANSGVPTEEEAKKKARNAATKAAAAATKAAYTKRITDDPNFKEECGAEKGNLEVTKCLGFGNKGLIEKVKADEATGTKRQVQSGLPEIVGYRVKNIGTQAYRYTTETWTQNEAGVFEKASVEKTLAPGAEADMCKVTFFNFLKQTQFGLATSNGQAVIKGTAAAKTLREIFKSAYFKFNADTNLNVHDDAIGEPIGPKEDTSVIYPQFLEEFGFLLNKPASKKKSAGGKAEKTSGLVMLTAYLQQKGEEDSSL